MPGFNDWVFNASPLWAKGALLGLHSRLHAPRKYGQFYREEVAALRRHSDLRADELEQIQRQRLADFLVQVLAKNAYFRGMMAGRKMNATAIEADPVAALLSLNILEKKFLKDNIETMTSEGIATFAISNTSGTSGSPMNVPYDAVGYQKGFAYWRRFYDGMDLGETFRNARFSGRVLLGTNRHPRVFWVHDWSEHRLFFSTYHMTEKNLPAYVARLNRYRPELIDGYPSALAILARFIESSGVRLDFQPQAAATTAETLFDEDRAVIERAFGCKVYNQYASSEGAPFITECAQGRMHLNTDTGFFEFHDVEGDGEVKELIVTSFRNVRLPLVRYRIGDTVRLDPPACPPCACGSAFPTVAGIEGRLDDLLHSTERGAIGRLDPVYKGVSGIERSQIIQEGEDEFRILVVPASEYGPASQEVLERNFRNRVGHSVGLTIEIVDTIPLGANGKFRGVINRSTSATTSTRTE
jgi:phenylacetate-CoA ligase